MKTRYLVSACGFLVVGTAPLATLDAQLPALHPAQTQSSSLDAVEGTRYAAAPQRDAILGGTDMTGADPDKSLNGSTGTPASLTEERQHRFFSSLALSSGYDTSAEDVSGASSGLAVAESYTGIIMRRRSYSMMIRHDAKVLRYFEAGKGTQQYQLTTALFNGAKRPKTNWSLFLENGFGSNAAWSVGSISAPLENMTIIPNRNSAILGLDNGNVLSDHMVFTVDHRVSETRTASLSAQGYYHHFFDTGHSDQRYGLSGSLDQRITRRQSIGIQAEAAQQIYSGARCSTGYVGVSALTQVSRSLRFEGRIGPTLGTGLCSGLFQYDVLLTMATARTNRIYMGADRQRSDGLVSNSTWQDSAFAGVAMGHPRQLMTLLDAGYSRYTISNPTSTSADLHGFFVSGELHHRMSHFSEVSLTARYFSTGAANMHSDRSLVMLTYTWSPEQRSTSTRPFGATHDGR